MTAAPDRAAGSPGLRAGVLGRPIAHSLSPVLHAAAYAELGLGVHYGRHELGPEDVAGFVRPRLGGPAGAGTPDLLGRGEDWLGVSVTMPLKAAVVAQAGVLSERVRLLGVANTLVRDHPEHPGRLWAHNTDVDGVTGALRAGGLADAAGGAVGVLGNGGTAAATVLAAHLLGADTLVLGVRDPARAADTAALAAGLGLTVRILGQDALVDEAPGLRAVVSTLPPRAADPLAARVPPGAALPPLLDAAYDPWPSVLARAWSAQGGPVVSGIAMLLHQGVAQARLFTERPRAARGDAEPDWGAVTAAAGRALGLDAPGHTPPAVPGT